ncbi:hypothetical protein BDV59DRAFT_176466 [Aspergillus ambiguus]|uniref:uncharacterized protein n=1 Tax=Aspergillus ambiguus TaxID=176160 RepID=UPI003CCDAC18
MVHLSWPLKSTQLFISDYPSNLSAHGIRPEPTSSPQKVTQRPNVETLIPARWPRTPPSTLSQFFWRQPHNWAGEHSYAPT